MSPQNPQTTPLEGPAHRQPNVLRKVESLKAASKGLDSSASSETAASKLPDPATQPVESNNARNPGQTATTTAAPNDGSRGHAPEHRAPRREGIPPNAPPRIPAQQLGAAKPVSNPPAVARGQAEARRHVGPVPAPPTPSEPRVGETLVDVTVLRKRGITNSSVSGGSAPAGVETSGQLPEAPAPPPPAKNASMFYKMQNMWSASAYAGQAQIVDQLRQQQMGLLRQQNEALQMENQRLENERQEMQEEIARQKSIVSYVLQEAQQASATSVPSGQGRWACEDEVTTRRRFENLNRGIQKWASANCAAGSLSDNLIWEFFDFSKKPSNIFSYDLTSEHPGIRGDQLPKLLLTALLSKDIYARIIGSPWYFLDFHSASEPTTGPESSSAALAKALGHRRAAGESMAAMLSHLQDADAKRAQKWRAEAFRMLFPKEGEPASQAGAIANEWTQRASRRFAADFIRGPARQLLSEAVSDGDRTHELAALYCRVGHMSNKLQAQLTQLQVLDQASLVGQPFFVGAGTMEAHRLHLLLDDEDTSADRRQVSLAVHPVVRVSGNDDGHGYGENFRILAKACVVLGKRAG